MKDILKKVHAHIPFDILPKFMEGLIKDKINPEIYFSHSSLGNLNKAKCLQTAKLLADAGLKVTFHAPFMDLRPGALDPKIRQISMDRLRQVFELAPYFHPLRIVCHPSFDDRYYVDCDELWLENSVETWNEIINLAKEAQTIIALENVYEKEPHILRLLLDRLSSSSVCFCFDTGHFNVFSLTPLYIWLEELGPYLGQLHLHDNHGKNDEHLPVGKGSFPFDDLFRNLREIKTKPVITLEAHNQADLWQSLENIKDMALLDFI